MVLTYDLVGKWVEVHTDLIFFHFSIKDLVLHFGGQYIKHLIFWNCSCRNSGA